MSTFCYLCAHVNAIHERGVHSTNTPAQKRVTFIFLTPCAAARRRARASTGRPRSWCNGRGECPLQQCACGRSKTKSGKLRSDRSDAASLPPTDSGCGKTRTPPSTFARFLFVKLVSSGRASQVCEYLERRGNPLQRPLGLLEYLGRMSQLRPLSQRNVGRPLSGIEVTACRLDLLTTNLKPFSQPVQTQVQRWR